MALHVAGLKLVADAEAAVEVAALSFVFFTVQGYLDIYYIDTSTL